MTKQPEPPESRGRPKLPPSDWGAWPEEKAAMVTNPKCSPWPPSNEERADQQQVTEGK